MKILPARNSIYFNLLFLGLIIPSFNPVLSGIISNEISSINITKESYFKKKLKFSSFINKNSKNQISDINFDLALNKNLDQSRSLEIQSDKQFQEKNVIYAEGNVLVTYKGNILKADKLVYDKLMKLLMQMEILN